MSNPLQPSSLSISALGRTPRQGERRFLMGAIALFIVIDSIIIAIFAAKIATSHASGVAACHITVAQLPSGLASPATALHSGQPTSAPFFQGQSLLIDGSSALYPLMQDGAQTLNSVDKTQVVVNKSSSKQGLGELSAGKIGMAMSDIYASEAPELQLGALDDYIVAVVPFTLIVSDDIAARITNLTSDQVKGIYTGAITNWQTLGGPDEPITAINRTADSGTRISFEHYVINGTPITAGIANLVDTTAAVVQQVRDHHGTIGYAATSDLVTLPADQRQQIHPLCIDGHAATSTDIADGDYHFWNFEHLYINRPGQAGVLAPTSVAAGLLDFVCGGDFQAKDVLTYGYLHITQLVDTVRSSHMVPTNDHDKLMSCATSAA